MVMRRGRWKVRIDDRETVYRGGFDGVVVPVMEVRDGFGEGWVLVSFADETVDEFGVGAHGHVVCGAVDEDCHVARVLQVGLVGKGMRKGLFAQQKVAGRDSCGREEPAPPTTES